MTFSHPEALPFLKRFRDFQVGICVYAVQHSSEELPETTGSARRRPPKRQLKSAVCALASYSLYTPLKGIYKS